MWRPLQFVVPLLLTAGPGRAAEDPSRATSLEEALKRPGEIKALILPMAPLASLPAEVGKLVQLETLTLTGAGLTRLPPEIGKLIHLKQLHLEGNKLTELPPEIGALVALESLDVSENELRALPPELGKLKKLKRLSLHNNLDLKTVPQTLKGLTALREVTVTVVTGSTIADQLKALLPRAKVQDVFAD